MRVAPGQTANALTNACCTGKVITSNTSGQAMEPPI